MNYNLLSPVLPSKRLSEEVKPCGPRPKVNNVLLIGMGVKTWYLKGNSAGSVLRTLGPKGVDVMTLVL